MMPNLLHNMDTALDRWLWHRGLRLALPRRTLRVLIALAASTLLVGLALWPVSRQIFFFSLGCALAALNIYSLSRTVGRLVEQQAAGGKRFLGVLFNLLRLAFTALILFFVLRLDPWLAIGLLSGFSSGVVVLAAFGFIFHKARE